jgi:hypothetical protein
MLSFANIYRQDLLIQIHTYIYLVVPGGGGSFDPNEKSPYPLTPIPLKKYESDYIEQLNNGSKEFALFKRFVLRELWFYWRCLTLV